MMTSNSTELSLTSSKTILLDYCDSYHISLHFLKILSKVVNFYIAILILRMEETSNIFSILYFIMSIKVKTRLKHKDLCSVWRKCLAHLIYQMCQKCLAKICAGDFLLDGASHSSRPVEIDSHQTETLIENNLHYTTMEKANRLKICKSSAENHLHQLGYINHFDVWVLHKLSEKTLTVFLLVILY